MSLSNEQCLLYARRLRPLKFFPNTRETLIECAVVFANHAPTEAEAELLVARLLDLAEWPGLRGLKRAALENYADEGAVETGKNLAWEAETYFDGLSRDERDAWSSRAESWARENYPGLILNSLTHLKIVIQMIAGEWDRPGMPGHKP